MNTSITIPISAHLESINTGKTQRMGVTRFN